MSRKSQIGDYLIAFIPRIIFLIIVLGVIFVLVNSYVKTEVDTFSAESSLFVQRLLYSKNGISFLDSSTGQVQPGIIDLSNASAMDEKLERSILYRDARQVAARIKLTNLAGEEIATFYYNKQWFDRWIVLTGYSGPGGSKSITRRLYVLLKDRYYADISRQEARIDAQYNDLVSQENLVLMNAELEILKSASKDTSLVPGYAEIVVVMPNS
jgi:hypothetical protein